MDFICRLEKDKTCLIFSSARLKIGYILSIFKILRFPVVLCAINLIPIFNRLLCMYLYCLTKTLDDKEHS